MTPVATLSRVLLELKLRKIGNSVGVVLPEEVLAHLKVQEGDTVAKKHPFVDGNKRTGFVVAALFLELNGYRLVANETEAPIHGLAAGETREADYASWMQAKSRPV